MHRIFLTALIAGAIAGVWVFAAHMMTTTPLILQAEVYELGGASHQSTDAHNESAHATKDPAPGGGLERSAYSLMADLITAMGFAFLLVGAMALSGQEVDFKGGMIWGLCGFAALSAAPAFGLAPELPGMASSDLQARQIWWVGTAAATAAGLALIFMAPQRLLKFLGAVLIVLPHIIGAPDHDVYSGDVPAALASQFAVTTLVISGLFWLLLGGLAGHFYQRFDQD